MHIHYSEACSSWWFTISARHMVMPWHLPQKVRYSVVQHTALHFHVVPVESMTCGGGTLSCSSQNSGDTLMACFTSF